MAPYGERTALLVVENSFGCNGSLHGFIVGAIADLLRDGQTYRTLRAGTLQKCGVSFFSVFLCRRSEGRKWGVRSVVVEIGVFGAPRFSVQRSPNTYF